MPDGQCEDILVRLRRIEASYEELNRRYLALADKRRCEIATAVCAGIYANPNSSGFSAPAETTAVEQANALIAELEKKRDE